jgi:LuxR family maltose regulon positive regulatory protein
LISTPFVATKLFISPLRSKAIFRPRLAARLNERLRQEQGFGRRLTLISATAGFGKTTLLSEWIAGCPSPVAWLSLAEDDTDPAWFLA